MRAEECLHSRSTVCTFVVSENSKGRKGCTHYFLKADLIKYIWLSYILCTDPLSLTVLKHLSGTWMCTPLHSIAPDHCAVGQCQGSTFRPG